MQVFLKDDAGFLKSVHVYEGNIINLATGNVESSEFVATIRLDNGIEHDPDVFCVEVNPSMTIKDLKDRIERALRYPKIARYGQSDRNGTRWPKDGPKMAKRSSEDGPHLHQDSPR